MKSRPINEDAAKAIQALAESIQKLTKVPVVLIVDDSLEDRELLRDQVTQFFPRCKIWGAQDGAEALDLLSKFDVDVVFLDVKLPKISGVDVLKHVSKINPPIVVMVTGFGEETAETIEAIKLGAVRVIAKPVTQDDLRATLSGI